MEETVNNETAGIPILSDIPLFGSLFSSKQNKRQTTELVILLKVSILDNNRTGMTSADQRLYECFAKDPRPLKDKN
jgi:MSHA biogenesis protein MshL